MVDDRSEATASLPDPERPKREPPTIDLEATEVSTATPQADSPAPSEPSASSEPAAEPAAAEPVTPPPTRPVSSWVVAPLSGAVAAAVVIGIGSMLGWPAGNDFSRIAKAR